jgi:hypothetical protein
MKINQKDADMMRNAIAFSQESLNTFNVKPSEMVVIKDEELISSTANTINHFDNYPGLNEILEPNKI